MQKMVNEFDKECQGSRSKAKKVISNRIKKNIHSRLWDFGKGKWIPVDELYKICIKETDFFKSDLGIDIFAEKGAKSKINYAVHQLRSSGHPIISRARVGNKIFSGYKYADETAKDFIHDWNAKLAAWEQSKSNLLGEAENDEKLIQAIIDKLRTQGRKEELIEMDAILVKYKKKRKILEEQENAI